LSLGGIFAFDLFVYSDAVVSGQIGTLFWGVRGYVVAMCVPMIGVSVSRIASWSRGIFVSRQVVFYTTTLVGSGLYLTAIGFTGYYIEQLGQDWGPALQIVFLSAAVLGFLVLLLSDQIRARIHIFVAKHFFERKYDYRAEWLRLIQTLTSAEDGLPLKKRAIKSLAQIVNSESGHLWLIDEAGKRYRSVSGWNVQPVEGEIAGNDHFIGFLGSSGWIMDLNELKNDPDKYQPLHIDSLPPDIISTAIVIPLQHEARLLGFVSLSQPRTPFTLNYEDHDLLKTAGQQIASYLAQEIGTEQLAESRQFEAYNRLTAFVMHDLKNAIAQQTLVVENAETHKRNPQFVDDAMEAIRGSVARLKRVIGHLQQRTLNQSMQKLDLSKLVLQAETHCSDRNPAPVASVPDEAVLVLANRDRLLMAVCHALRNAQDATEANGRITVELTVNESDCDIRISDTGTGMDAEFVRDRLFRPFDSTKGPEGMGIGAYQIRETVLAYGGDVSVDSVVKEGTTLTLNIPLAAGGTQ
jgi:putative PEP-CTERM system histidine kinase